MIKYGLLVNKKNENLGDDVQSYAESLFLPRVDLELEREKLSYFKTEDEKTPVALIMGAWFMWKKFNWPPSNQIVPLNVGYHHFDRKKDVYKSNSYAIPIFREHYTGVGGQWLKDYGPVGCRDYYTKKVFEEEGIPCYFSGCVTLTLPKQKTTKEKGKYVVLVDLNKKVEKKVKKLIGNKYKIITKTHKTPIIENATWEERKARVVEYLTLYQNAKYVVTSRLHVSLPCLAMETPVLVIQGKNLNDPNRFEPYRDWLHYAYNEEFLNNKYEFDFENGTPNKKTYQKTRKELIKRINDFIAYCEKNKNKSLEFFIKTSYSELDYYKWRCELMNQALENTHIESKSMWKALKCYQNYNIFQIFCKRMYDKYFINKKDNKLVVKMKKIIKKS